MPTDKQLAKIILSLYNDEENVFDVIDQVEGDADFGFKSFSDHDVIAIEGTHNLSDIESDLKAAIIHPNELHGAGCHEGGYQGLPAVKEKIAPLISKTKPLYVIGHSLGAIRAYIFAAMLYLEGYNVILVVWGPPRAGDIMLANIIKKFPNRAYWNFKDKIARDPFGDVPVYIPYIEEYCITSHRTLVLREPDLDDKWGPIIGFHHMEYYYEVTPG